MRLAFVILNKSIDELFMMASKKEILAGEYCIEVVALRTIGSGEELLHCYVNPEWNVKKRRERLLSKIQMY